MKRPLAPLGITQGVAHAALVGPEELARRAGRETLVRLGSNESPFGASPLALAALAREAQASARYGDPSCFELRSAVARNHGVGIENVTVGAGIDDLLGWIVRAYLPEGGRAIAGLGTFPTFEMHATGYGVSLDRVPYGTDCKLDLAGFARSARRTNGAMVFFPNPDNPTGSWYRWAEVLAFADALPDGSLVVHDEAYANFLSPEDRFPPDAIDARLIRLRTFSKEHGLAGLRVAYALGAPDAIAALDAVRLLYGVSRPAQAAAAAALEDAAFVAEVVRRVAEGREAYYRLGAELGIPTRPSVTNFVLFDLGDADRAKRTMDALLAHGIHVRKPPYAPLDRYVRISVGTPPETERLRTALRAMLFER